MAAPQQQIFKEEETLNLIREKAKEVDNFNIKIYRVKHISLPAEVIASFSGAVLQNLVDPQLWLPQVAGGGKYRIQAYHQSDLAKPVGGFLSFLLDSEPREVDISAATRPGWQGPAELTYPLKEVRSAPDEGYLGTPIRPPPGPGSGNSATGGTPVWGRSPGGGSVRRVDYENDPDWERTPRGLTVLEMERRKLEEEKLSAERDRTRERLEAQAKAHEADLRALRAEMTAKIDSVRNTGPDPMAGLITMMMTQAAEDRRAAEARASAERLAQQAAQQASDARFALMIEKMNDKPKENPLEMVAKVAEILHKGNSNEASMKMMHNMAEMHGVQMETAMNFIEHAANLQMGGQSEEPGWVKALDSAVKTIGSIAKGVTLKKPMQLAAPQPPPPQQLPPEAPQPPRRGPPPPKLEQFIEAIKRGGGPTALPVQQIAEALKKEIMDPSIQEAFHEAGMDFEKVIQKHLSNWANEKVEHAAYLQALIAEVKRVFIAAGWIEADGAPAQQDPAGEEQEDDGDYEDPNVQDSDEGDEAAE